MRVFNVDEQAASFLEGGSEELARLLKEAAGEQGMIPITVNNELVGTFVTNEFTTTAVASEVARRMGAEGIDGISGVDTGPPQSQ